MRRWVAVGTAVGFFAIPGFFTIAGGGFLTTLIRLLPELPARRSETRLTSPDGRTDLVLTWIGRGGAAGSTEETIGLEPHGTSGEGEELASFDPSALVGARWLSGRVAEIGLDEPIGSLPTTIRVAGRAIELKTRDFRHCRLALFRQLPPAEGLSILVQGWDCGDGAGRLFLSKQEPDFQVGLADAAIHWPVAALPTVRGNAIRIPARRLYPGEREELVGDAQGGSFRVLWGA